MLNALLFIYSTINLSLSSEAIGFYSNGSLRDAVNIKELDPPSIHKLFLPRGRFFTTAEMSEVIINASLFVHEEFPEFGPIQLGDLSNQNGGTAKGHQSHQNGLDSDVVYLSHKNYLQNPSAPFWEEEFIYNNAVSENFDPQKNWELFKYLAMATTVQRIFVDEAIKKALCLLANESGEINTLTGRLTLQKLRSAALHTNHFHLRLSCPENDLNCTPQSAPPAESGCTPLEILLGKSALREDQSC